MLSLEDRLLQHQQEATRLEERYQDLAAQYYQAQAAYHANRLDCQRLRGVLHVKQWVINELMPHYPHSITPELRHGIDLA